MKNLKLSEKTNLCISITSLISIICATAYLTNFYSKIENNINTLKNDVISLKQSSIQLNDKMIAEFFRRDNIALENGKSRSIQIDKLQEYIVSISNNSLRLRQLTEDIKDLEQDIKTLR